MMPQKKNPQVAEHLRGRAGVAIGRLAAMLAVCKGLPLAYDSDLQEDKELAFAQVASFDGALRATALLVGGLRFDAERMRAAAADGATVATDVAEALVRDGMPFREAHEQVASRIAAGERFAEPTPEEAVAARDAPGRHGARARRGAARGAHLAHRGDARLGAFVTPLGSPWPATAESDGGGLRIGGVAAEELAERFGTPLYVYDAATLRERAQAYVDGVAGHPDAHVSFACKACCTVGVLRLLRECGLGADVASAGELAAALRAGIDPERIVVHGNGKTDADIDAAVAAGCGLVVLDGLDEGARVAAAAAAPRAPPAGRGARHAGHRGRRAREDRDGARAARSSASRPPTPRGRASRRASDPRLDWRGLHVHLGSQVDDPGVLEGVVRWFRRVLRRARARAAADRRRRRARHPVRRRVAPGRPARWPRRSRQPRSASSPPRGS